MIALLCVIHLLILNPSLANAAPALVQTATASNQLATPADTVSTDTSLALSTEMEIFDERPYFFFSLMAKVTAAEGTPTGLVTFFWIDALGDEQIIGNRALNSQGIAYYSDWRFGEFRTYELSARYEGDDGFVSSTSKAVIHTWENDINIIATSTSNPSAEGQAIDLGATVYSPNGSPTGTVTFFHADFAMENVETIGAAELDANGMAKFNWTPDAGGTYQVYARYEGDDVFKTITSTAVTHFVAVSDQPLTDTTILLTIFHPSVGDQSLSLSASVAADRGTPRGEVTFFAVDSASGNESTIETVELSLQGLASGSWTPDGSSSHIGARFAENEVFKTSTSDLITATLSSETATTLVSTQNPVAKGEMLSLVATIAPLRHVASFAGAPTGTVNFSWSDPDSGIEQNIGSADVDANGVGSLNWTPDPGCYSVSAVYEGDRYFDPSSASLQLTVTNGGDLTGFADCPVSTSIISTPSPSVSGQEVALTVSVTSTAGTPAGTVKIYLPGDEATEDIIGTAELDANGVASLRFTPDNRFGGCTEIVADYSGNDHFKEGVAQLPLALTDRAKCDTGLNLIDRLQPLVVGQAFTLEASVYSVAVFDGIPNGTVTFFYVDSSSNSEQIIGTAELDAGGSASLDWFPSIHTATIGARYEGAEVFNPSSDSRSAWLVDNSVRTPAIYLPLFSR